MHDGTKSKGQLLAELFELRVRISNLEKERVKRRQDEETLKAERKRLFNVLEALPAMICLLTPDYHIAFANRAFRERFGESHGRHCYDHCFGRCEPCEFCEAYKVLETGLPHHWEITVPDGSVIDAYDFPFTDADGSPLILEMDIDITERKRIEEELRRSRGELELRVKERTADLESANEKLRQVPSRLIQAQEEERKRLAAELHDSIGQTLAALKFRIEHILAVFRKGRAKEALQVAEGFISILQRSLDETRSIYMGLRPKVLEDFGAVAALMWYRKELMGPYPELHIEMDITIEKSEIPDNLVVPIFRITQEALNNVCRHSQAEWVDVRLALNNGAIELEIGDDGVGMDLGYIMESSTAKSLGLIAMRERAELIGGKLTIQSAPGKGTTVLACWPLAPMEKILVT